MKRKKLAVMVGCILLTVLICVMIGHISYTSPTHSRGELPHYVDFKVHAAVERDATNDIWIYKYTFVSDARNKGDLEAVDIDLAEDTSRRQFADKLWTEWGVVDPRMKDDMGIHAEYVQSGNERMAQFVLNEMKNTPVVPPVRKKALPDDDWFFLMAGRMARMTIGGGDLASVVLSPGGQVSGITIESKGIPRVRRFVARAYLDLDKFYPSIDAVDEVTGDGVIQQVDSDRLRTRVGGKTIGPTLPPEDVHAECDTFLAGLIDQVREAAESGWIKHGLRKGDHNRGSGEGGEKSIMKGLDDDDSDDRADDDVDMGEKDDLSAKALAKAEGLPGAAKSIIKKLTKVRRECLRGKFSDAREKLRALIKQVNAQRGKHLTEEAYALIKFNAEILLEKL